LILFSTPLPTTTLFISQHMQRTAASRTRNKNCYHFRQTQRQSRFCSQDSAIQFFIFTVESVSHLFYLHRSARTTDPEITNSRHNRARLCFPPLSARDVIKRELQKLHCCIWNVKRDGGGGGNCKVFFLYCVRRRSVVITCTVGSACWRLRLSFRVI
jgi:hypothetical protein